MSLVGTRPPTVDEWDKYELHGLEQYDAALYENSKIAFCIFHHKFLKYLLLFRQ